MGIAKDLPAEEVQALLLASTVVSQDAMRELALQRGVAVKDYLASKQLPVERLFLGGAKAGAGDVSAVSADAKPAGTERFQSGSESRTAAAPAKWTPRAELNLATN